MPKEIPMAGGIVTSSEQPPLHLIPTEFFIRAAERFALGIERKGDKAWNAISSNQACLTDQAFILERIGHLVQHSLKLRDKILRGAPMDGDDDAGAIAWSAAFLCSATRALADAKPRARCSACGGAGTVVHRGENDAVRTCPACKGTGKQGGAV